MRLVLFTGKGGVGRTTTAAATAVHAAGHGRKTLLVSADPARSLTDVLDHDLRAGGDDNDGEPLEITAGLFALAVDPAAVARRVWGPAEQDLLAALDDLGVAPLAADDLLDLPGLDDLLTLLVLRDQVRDGPWDLVVVDCPAAPFRLLTAADRCARLLARLLPMDRRIARLGTRATRRDDPLVIAADALTAGLAQIRSVLTGPGTSVRLVTTPQAVVLAGTRRLYTALVMSGFAVDAVVVNRSPLPGTGAHPDGAGEFRASVREVPVVRLPSAVTEPRGVELLADLGAALAGALGEELPVPAAPPFEIARAGTGFTLSLRVPLARREDLDLGRRGDDLVVTVPGHRRVLPLPSALRRCRVEGARLRDGVLTVTFVPDPDEFPARWV